LTIISNSSFLWYPFSNLLAPNIETQRAVPTATTATLYGRLYDFGASSSARVWFKYRKEGDENWQKTDEQTRTQTGDFYVRITGLTPETTYQFQACASHPGGENENCDKPLEFTTKSRPPFDFTLSCDPSQDLIPPGNNTTFTLNVENVPSEAERQTVTFSFSVRPPENGNANDITFSPTQPSCSAGNGQTSCNVTVTVSASGNATLGDYQITITGTAPNGQGGSVSKTTFYTLTVGGRCVGTGARCIRSDPDSCRRGEKVFACGGEGTCEGTDGGNRCVRAPVPCDNDSDCENILVEKDCGGCPSSPPRLCPEGCQNANSDCSSPKDCYKCVEPSERKRCRHYCLPPDPNICVRDEDCPPGMSCTYP
jgi:hypothetical protein